jgi:single-strand DNA-binding protein
MNKVILIGNLTRDTELRQTPNGVSVCTFSIAVSRDYTNSDGSKETDFFNIVVWREKGENCAKYLKKGKKVAVVGSLQNRSYEDNDGAKRYVTEVIASDVEFLSPKEQEQSVVSATRPVLEAIDDNQLPF